MKHPHDTIATSALATIQTISQWLIHLQRLHQRLRPHFARPEPHGHAFLYLKAILSEIPRKNGWQIAEHGRQSQPFGIQRLLSHATWNQDGLRDDTRALVREALWPCDSPQAGPFPVLVIDESGFPKRGKHSAGVALQYCGITGRVENCQVGVFLSYATALGHALIDRELYMPEDWCADPSRRQMAHLPETLRFRTKPELGQAMVQRAQMAGLLFHWVTADTVYGHSPDLRQWLEKQGHAFALAVPSSEVIGVQTSSGPLLRDAATIASQLRARAWQRLSQSLGTKGERLFDWAILPWMQADRVDQQHFLVIRRCLDDPNQLAFFLVFTPRCEPLSTIVQVLGARWHMEEDLQVAKDLGLDHYEVRSFPGWYRHVTLVLLACAFLVSIAASAPKTASLLLPLTTSEIRHLLARLFFAPPTSALLICQWSHWRRTHQYWAGYYHRRRRQKPSLTH